MFYTFLILCSILLVLLPIAWIISLIRYLYARRWDTKTKELERKRSFIVTSVTCGAALLVFGILMLVISYSAIAYM